MQPIEFLWLPLAYLLGSVPYGFLAGKLRGVDLRREGSGNIGATNALRVLGKPWGITVFFLDFLKGWLPLFVAAQLGVSEPILVGMAVLVIVGHNFPVWLGFRGGKGIATSAGVILGLFSWMVLIASILAWCLLFFTTRYVSLGSIAASLMLTISMAVLWFLGMTSTLLLGVASLMTVLALLRHRSNISRLLAGTESRFQRRSCKVPPAETSGEPAPPSDPGSEDTSPAKS